MASDRHACGRAGNKEEGLVFLLLSPSDHGGRGLCSLEKCLFHTWHFVPSELTEGARPSVPGALSVPGPETRAVLRKDIAEPPSAPS